MVRLRIALAVASSLVAVAALTIVFAGTGVAQGTSTGPNVTILNTPLPVTGNVNATIPGTVNVAGNVTATIPGTVNVAGNVNAAVTGDVTATVTGNVNAAVTGDVNATVTGPVTVNNPSNNPVLIRDVDGQGPKQLWQMAVSLLVPEGAPQSPTLDIDVPAGKVLVIEHLNFRIGNTIGASMNQVEVSLSSFGFFGGPSSDIQVFEGQPNPGGSSFNINATTKFYVSPGGSLGVRATRFNSTGVGVFHGVLTGYLVNYP